MEYQFESIGPALRWIVLAFLFVFVMAVVAAAAGVAALPGWIARRRRHPQATAINACGWFGLPTGINEKPTMFAVRVRLDDAERRLPGGARGQVAVYTEDLQIAGLPVMFLIRAKSWMNYLF